MTPGDPSIRKIFDKICPRYGGEQIPAWQARVARKLGWDAARVTSLYKDRRCRLSDEEGIKLRSVLDAVSNSGGSAGLSKLKNEAISNESFNRSRLAGALERDDDINGFIKDIINDHTQTILRQFALSLLEALPRDSR